MSDLEAKGAREAALIRALHGGSAGDDDLSPTPTPNFDGGARIDHTLRSSPLPPCGVLGPFPSEKPEPGWSVEYEIEDGAELIFPWLEKDQCGSYSDSPAVSRAFARSR